MLLNVLLIWQSLKMVFKMFFLIVNLLFKKTKKQLKYLPQASIGNGSCGANIDWNDMLADYDGMKGNI